MLHWHLVLSFRLLPYFIELFNHIISRVCARFAISFWAGFVPRFAS